MIYQRKKLLNDLLFFFFALFVVGSTFSIALAQISLGLSLLLFLVVVVSVKYNPFAKELKWLYTFIGLYILWMIVSALAGRTPVESMKILKEEWLFCAVPIAIYLLSKDNYRRYLVTAFAIGVGLLSLYGIVQFFTGVHWFKTHGPDPGPEIGFIVRGNFPSPMTFGNYFGTAAGFFSGFVIARWREFDKRARLFYGIVAILAILATLGSYNRGAILGLPVALIVLSVSLKRWKLLASIAAVLLIGVSAVALSSRLGDRIYTNIENELDADNEGGRMFIWNNSAKIAVSNPAFGVGQGNFRHAYLKLLRDDIPDNRKRVHAHNDFLNIAAIGGIPAVVFFAGIWVSVFGYIRCFWPSSSQIPGLKPMLAAALTGSTVFLVTSLTESTFADEEVRQMLMFIWAVGLFFAGSRR